MSARLKQMAVVVSLWLIALVPALAQDNGGKAGAKQRAAAAATSQKQVEKSRAEEKAGEDRPLPTPGARLAAELGEKLKAETFGFLDKDGDGVNDRFADVNGDGINDVSGKPYFHRFLFLDRDGDGVNDLFTDADGDGVNDLDIRWVDTDTDGVCDNVVDTNGDGINDITGLQFNRKSLRGYKFGRINEERDFLLRNFIDEDMDGLPDMRPLRLRGAGMRPPFDRFIDRDGDGIDDRRQPHQRLRRGGAPMGGPK